MDKSLKAYWQKRDLAATNKALYNGDYCCAIMDFRLDKSNPENLSPIEYNPKFREYYLKLLLGSGGDDIVFCPECGTKLPKELRDEWFDVLEQEYGLDDPGWPEQQNKIPVEFKTDEWWKRRNL